MDNFESILDELNDYDQLSTPEIPKCLEEFINHLAKTGDIVFPWSKVRGVIRHKLVLVISAFKELCPTESLPPCPNVEPFHYETMKDKILEQFDSFTNAPFTIQRLCELLSAPRKHYKRTDKFMRGIEKNLLVVSTIDPEQRKKTDASSQSLVNGVMEAHVAPNRPSLMSYGQSNQRPSSAASDVTSAYDADSGISDTEEEEKLCDRPLELEAKEGASQEPESTAPTPPVLEAQVVTETEAETQTQTETETQTQAEEETPVPPAPLKDEEPSSKSEEEQAKNNEIDVEGLVEELPIPTVADKSAAPNEEDEAKIEVSAEDSPVAEVKECPADKKRPLEEDEDDDIDTNREAKQPRMFSPDKTDEVKDTDTVSEDAGESKAEDDSTVREKKEKAVETEIPTP